jgi:hypothetical protein
MKTYSDIKLRAHDTNDEAALNANSYKSRSLPPTEAERARMARIVDAPRLFQIVLYTASLSGVAWSLGNHFLM